MTARRTLLLNAAVTVALVIVIAACANFLSVRSFARLDLTADDSFSLSPAARTIVKSLDGPVQVELFLSDPLPSQFALHTQAIRDKLDEFAAVAQVPFVVVETDPGEDEAAKARAQRLGVSAQQAQVRSKGKLELQLVYLGLAIQFRDAQEVLPFIDRTETLEYDLARALRALQGGGEKKVVGVVTGHGEPDLAAAMQDPRNPLRNVAAVLSENYTLRAIDLGAEGSPRVVPEDVDVLLLLGPQQALDEGALYAVDQHVMRGGALAVFPLAAVPDTRTRQVQPRPVDLEPLLGAWGVDVTEELVLDRELNGIIQLPVQVRTPFGMAMSRQQVNSPLVPLVRDLDRDHPVSKGIDTLVVPFAARVDAKRAVSLPGIEAVDLARTAPSSAASASIKSLDPQLLAAPTPDEVAGPHTVLVALEGSFASSFVGGPPAAPGVPPDATAVPRSAAGTRIVVGGSFEMPLANAGLLIAAVDWMALDELLLGIRPKMSAPPLLDPLDEGTRSAIRAANVFGVPLLFALFGWFRARARRRRA